MPGKGLLTTLTDKAQAALAGTPLAGKIPTGSSHATTGSDASEATAAPTTQQQQPGYAPPAQEQSGTLSGRHHGLEALQHQFRTLQAQYSSGVSQENRQLQLLITAAKGVALDFDSVSRDAKAQSKELYLWGQTQAADIKDVTDRLAYLNFVHGSLSYTLATDLDKSRTAWKNVRDAEAALAPRRAARTNITTQITKLKGDGGKVANADARLAELDAQLKKAEADDAPLERELDLLKRTAIKEGETIKWKALQEYAHKLLLLAGASEQLLRVLPSSPPENYAGHQQTAAVRAALQNALDSGYVPKSEHLPLNVGQHAGETRSFGETHASELSTITTVTDDGHESQSQHTVTHHDADPINPAALNNAPAPIPHNTSAGSGTGGTSTHYNAPVVPPSGHYAPPTAGPPPTTTATGYAPPSTNPPGTSPSTIPKAPTVAETGVPVSAGATGPGPASGNLHADASHPTVGYGVGTDERAPPYGGAPTHESAEEEKRRLAAMEQAQNAVPIGGGNAGLGTHGHQGGLHASTSTRRPPANESAEDEKKRLEREERERVLHANAPPTREPTQDDGSDPTGGAAPPAYQD